VKAKRRVGAQLTSLVGITLFGLLACRTAPEKPLPSAVTNAPSSAGVGLSTTSGSPNQVRAEDLGATVSASSTSASLEPLRIAYSRDAGFEHWAKVEQSGAFSRRGLAVQLTAYEHTAALEAFSAGRADAVTATNAEVLVGRHLGSPCTAIAVSWVGVETEVLFTQKKYDSLISLAGTTIGVELGQPEHLALEHQLRAAGLHEKVRLVNVVAEVAHDAFTAGALDAVMLPHTVAQRFAARAKTARRFQLPLAHPVLYGVLCVRQQSLAARRAEWTTVASAWRESVRAHVAAPTDLPHPDSPHPETGDPNVRHPNVRHSNVRQPNLYHPSVVTLIDDSAPHMPALLAATREFDAFYVRMHVYASSVFDAVEASDLSLLP